MGGPTGWPRNWPRSTNFGHANLAIRGRTMSRFWPSSSTRPSPSSRPDHGVRRRQRPDPIALRRRCPRRGVRRGHWQAGLHRRDGRTLHGVRPGRRRPFAGLPGRSAIYTSASARSPSGTAASGSTPGECGRALGPDVVGGPADLARSVTAPIAIEVLDTFGVPAPLDLTDPTGSLANRRSVPASGPTWIGSLSTRHLG